MRHQKLADINLLTSSISAKPATIISVRVSEDRARSSSLQLNGQHDCCRRGKHRTGGKPPRRSSHGPAADTQRIGISHPLHPAQHAKVQRRPRVLQASSRARVAQAAGHPVGRLRVLAKVVPRLARPVRLLLRPRHHARPGRRPRGPAQNRL
jgi:hypothetical protein